jgi:branched-chain amino acid transport system ATP-binding protein
MPDNLLVAEAVSKKFGALQALGDVNLEVPEGSIVGLIGPNGAGKTTMFNALSGFSPASSGTVRFAGRDITRLRPHQIAKLGLVRTFQTARPLRNETVLENVLTGTHLSGRATIFSSLFTSRRTVREERAHLATAYELLDRVGLGDYAESYPSGLAAGQLRLLEIARALAAEPRLVLLDEPAAGLNQVETRALEETLVQLRAGGTTVVIVEHDVELVLRLCDSVTVLNFGRVLTSGAPDQIRNDPAVAEAYFGSSTQDDGKGIRPSV